MPAPELVTLGVLSMDMDTVMLRGGASGDWLVVGADATATLDLRFTLESDDGALIYMHGAGHTNANEFPKGGPIWFAPIFETAEPKYAWLNAIQGLAKGHAQGPHARFEVWEPR